MGVDYELIPSNFDERLDDNRPTEQVAIELALGKALDVAQKYPGSVVIGSDTIVTIDGKQLGKPSGTEEAYEILKKLSGTAHSVTTAVVVVRLSDNIQLVGVDTTTVYFKPYDETAVKQYVETGDSLDKAGAYGIQSGAATLVDHIEGHYDTVVGLPTHLLVELLTKVGIQSNAVELESAVKQILR